MKRGLLILMLFVVGLVKGQTPLLFEHLTVDDGLANNSVRSVLQDADGYLWFGTLNGLSRYDGQRFANFGYEPGNPASISNNKIRELVQDSLGYIWISTYDDLVHRYDPRTEQFINFPDALGPQFRGTIIDLVFESSPGVMWLSLAGSGCARVIAKPNSSDFNVEIVDTSNLLPANTVYQIRAQPDGGLWVGTSNGIVFLPNDRLPASNAKAAIGIAETQNSAVTRLLIQNDTVWAGCSGGEFYEITGNKGRLIWKSNHSNKSFNQFSFINRTRDGWIYGGTRNGLLRYSPKTGGTEHLSASNSGLPTNYLTGCYQDKTGDLWMITNLRGIVRFQPKIMHFTHYPLHPDIRQSIVEGEKQIFVEDTNGSLWIGIYGGGISRFNRQTEGFEQYLHEDNNPASLSSNLVLSLFQDKSGNLWAGTYKRGLDKINLQATFFRSINDSKKSNSDFLGEVRALFEDSRHWIWTGNKRGEVMVYNQNFELQFRLNDWLTNNAISTGIYCFEEDGEGNMWIGTKGDGIIVLTGLPKTGNTLQTKPGLVRLTRWTDPALSRNDVFDLHLDRKDQMWVAMYHGGINIIRNPLKANTSVLSYLQNPSDPYALADNRVRCFLEDHNGNMWIGTANGLSFVDAANMDTDNKQFIPILQTNREGSISYNDIICLFEDSKQQINIGTYGGGINQFIGRDADQNFSFKQTKQENGLSSNLILSFVEDRNNNLWVSTDFGLCKIYPDSNKIENFYVSDGLKENSFSEGKGMMTDNGIVAFGDLSGLLVFQPEQITKQERPAPVVLTDLLVNNHANKELLQEARQLASSTTGRLKLKYDQNFLTFEFAALDYKAPSKIQYEFKLDNYEKNWNRSGNLNKAIYRELQPGDYLFRLKASNSDGLWVNPELLIPVTILPPPWKTWWAYLLYAFVAGGLFVLIRRFTLERIKLKHEVEFEKQLADDKLKFYTSISHEFKTPLALILGPVEDLLADKNLPPHLSKPLHMVKRNTRRLLELLEQLMDFRKIQKGFLKAEQTPGDLVFFLTEIYQAFQPIAEKKNIAFTFNKDREYLHANIDYKSLEKVVFNLLSNAFKHTAEGQKVELHLHVDESRQQLVISVQDKGEGIHEQDIPMLFERFSFGRRSRWKDESSTGIGLSLTKELVDLLGGTIQVESTLGEGSCFTVTVPYQQGMAIGQVGVEINYTQQFIQTHDNETEETTNENNSRALLKKQSILVVEDNTDLRNWLAAQLGSRYQVLQAENGKIGMEIAKNEDPELIICDVMMPEMDGLELTSVLKSEFHTSHIPIILLTAKSLEEHKIEGIETGADDYITKPFNMLYLQKRIENILRQRKQLRERFSRDVNAGATELHVPAADQEFMTKVIALVEAKLSDPDFSVDSLLPHFNFGRTVFFKKMKGISGYAPKDFVRIVRMKKAGKLLSDPGASVTEVAFEVGYSDANYFSRQFKKHFGENPSDFHKHRKQGSN
ncbi:MAG: two-component regulator propeller domain-containing protein [Mangrovibacterium sp.]